MVRLYSLMWMISKKSMTNLGTSMETSVSARLRFDTEVLFQASDFCYRIGGDEFGVLSDKADEIDIFKCNQPFYK